MTEKDEERPSGDSTSDAERSFQIPSELPVLPRENDAATTAVYIQSVVSGEKPAPSPLTQQVDCLMSALAAIHKTAGKEQIA